MVCGMRKVFMCCMVVQLVITATEINTKSYLNRVATDLENLEYSGISLNMENSWNSQGILCNLGEN